MGKFREFIPVAAATIIIALCALLPFAIGTGDNQGLSDVRSATAGLAQAGLEQQSVQAAGQASQQALTEAIVAAHQQGASVKQIASAVVPILGNITPQQAEQGVQGIIAQAKAAQTPPAATPATPTTP